jgi:TMEM175 potassium channel family protein
MCCPVTCTCTCILKCTGALPPVLYLIVIPLALVNSWIAAGLYLFLVLLWLIPDPRIEKEIEKREE